MKQRFFYLIVLSLLACAFILLSPSCKKSNDSDANMVYDLQGNAYHTVTIGTQTWMVENLMSTKYNTGIDITYIGDTATTVQLVNGAYTNYNNSSDYAAVFGRLYNWFAVNSGTLAPKGWHVATNDDWATLAAYLGGLSEAGGALKQAGTTYWSVPNLGATNSSGFTALPGGYRYHNSISSTGEGDAGIWWTGSQADSLSAYYYELTSDEALLTSNAYDMRDFFSVRCVKN